MKLLNGLNLLLFGGVGWDMVFQMEKSVTSGKPEF
jgi:hypothetical protein